MFNPEIHMAIPKFRQVKEALNEEKKADRPPVGRVPSEGGNEEIGVNVDDPDHQREVEAHLGKNPDENARVDRSREPSEANVTTDSSTGKPRSSGETTPAASTSQLHQKETPTASSSQLNQKETPAASTSQLNQSSQQQQTDPQNKKPPQPAGPDEPFELWERELMEEMLNDIKGHLGSCFIFADLVWMLNILQYFIRLVSWRAKMLPTTFYSMLIGA